MTQAVEFSLASIPGSPDRPNEDFAATTANAFVVLDGVTPGPEDSGCRHGVPWYVQRLGTRLLTVLGEHPDRPLPACLADAIAATSALHADTCDLSRRMTPQATVAAGRFGAERVEYLVLADCTVVLDLGEEVRTLTDDRVEHAASDLARAARALPEGSSERAAARARYAAAVAGLRNAPGGFWTAAADPRVAEQALTGWAPRESVHALAALTDGAARYVDVLHRSDWPTALKLLASGGPTALLTGVRAAEDADPGRTTYPRGKRSDDATVVLALSAGYERP
jgi:hypothetical protein